LRLEDSPPTFDPLAHQRKRARNAEARADALERENAQLIRLLIITLEHHFRDTNIDPLQYLNHLCEIDLLCRDLSLDAIAHHRLAA
jgi:hypothetical protein